MDWIGLSLHFSPHTKCDVGFSLVVMMISHGLADFGYKQNMNVQNLSILFICVPYSLVGYCLPSSDLLFFILFSNESL
jgi:hypothetical protein